MNITCEMEYKKAHEEFCRLWDQKYTGNGLQPDQEARFCELYFTLNKWTQLQAFSACIAAGDYRS